MLCSKGFTFWDRIIDCLGLVPGGAWYGPLSAGPERDIRILGAVGFLIVAGTGKCERAFESTGCIVDRLRSAISSMAILDYCACFAGPEGVILMMNLRGENRDEVFNEPVGGEDATHAIHVTVLPFRTRLPREHSDPPL